MTKTKPATVGERIVMGTHVVALNQLRTLESCRILRNQARRIDAVVKREVKKALKARHP